MQTPRILMVVTSSDRAGTAPEPTGLWLEEATAPYYTFRDAKSDVTIASPKGGQAPIDPRSVEASAQTASTRRFASDAKAQHALAHTIKLSSISLDDYDAVFFAGGHGTMDDFATDATVRDVVEHFWHAARPVAAVCHGPAALINAHDRHGRPIVLGRQFTCFSDTEEEETGLHRHMPFLLETKLRGLGGHARQALPFQPNAVVDGLLITGQNPPSSIPVAEALIHQLRLRGQGQAAA